MQSELTVLLCQTLDKVENLNHCLCKYGVGRDYMELTDMSVCFMEEKTLVLAIIPFIGYTVCLQERHEE